MEEAEDFVRENNLFFLETSALDNSDQMIERVFLTLSEDILKKKAENGDLMDDDIDHERTHQIELNEGESGGAQRQKNKKKCAC